MTCPSLRCRPVAAELFGDLPRATADRAQDAAARLTARLRRDDTAAQFARFVLVGATCTLLYGLLFVALEKLGYLPAHLMGTVASSVVANDLHRRITFRAEERVGWLTAQVEAGGVSLAGLVATSAALGWLDATTGSAPLLLQIALVTAVTGLIGLVRFAALRWIFRPAHATV